MHCKLLINRLLPIILYDNYVIHRKCGFSFTLSSVFFDMIKMSFCLLTRRHFCRMLLPTGKMKNAIKNGMKNTIKNAIKNTTKNAMKSCRTISRRLI